MIGQSFCRKCNINIKFPIKFEEGTGYPLPTIYGNCPYCKKEFIGFSLCRVFYNEPWIKGWFSFDTEWHCPGCGTSKEKLVEKRKAGLFSGIDEHHFGNNPNEDYGKYLDGNSILLCHHCNSLEPHIRKIIGSKNALAPEGIAHFLEENPQFKKW